jgi:hypothetical protein
MDFPYFFLRKSIIHDSLWTWVIDDMLVVSRWLWTFGGCTLLWRWCGICTDSDDQVWRHRRWEIFKVIIYTNNSIKIIFHPTLFHPTRFEIYVLSLSKITFYHHINFFLVDVNWVFSMHYRIDSNSSLDPCEIQMDDKISIKNLTL